MQKRKKNNSQRRDKFNLCCSKKLKDKLNFLDASDGGRTDQPQEFFFKIILLVFTCFIVAYGVFINSH